MLFLVFELGTERYALDARQIAEVLPLVAIRHIPETPSAVSGVFNYRGAPVPVIDVSRLTLGRPAAHRLSTRIVVVHYPGTAGDTHLLGLIAEKATQTVRHEPADFLASGVSHAGASYLGPIATDPRGLLQWIDVRTLLPTALRDLLFTQPKDDRWRLPTLKTC
jgi:chemotaxis-related protein WspB